MTESLPPVSSELKGESADKLRGELVADYLCATNPQKEEMALAALRKDEFRLAMAGMTPGQRELWNTFDKVDWKAVQREGLTAVMPLLFGAYIGLTSSPENATRITTVLGSAGFGLEMLSMAAAMPEAMARHQRASGLAKAIAAVRVGMFYAGKVGLFTALGTGAATLVHRGWEAQAATQQAGAELPLRSDWVEEARAQGWPSAEQRFQAGGGAEELRAQGWQELGGQPLAEQVGPPKFTPEQADLINRIGHPELVEGQQREAAELAANQAAAAARQAGLEAVLTPQQLTGVELTGGTVWGHEGAFVRGLGNIAHQNAATNALKNLAYGLEQGQPFTQIGPTDVVNLVNPDVGAKIAEAASNIVGRDPSTLTGVDKMLWELGLLGEHATRAVAETVIKAFANK